MSTETTPEPTTRALAPFVHVCVPSRWRRRDDPEHGVLLAARAPTSAPTGLPAEVVVRWTPVDGDLRAWREEHLAACRERLLRFELDDADEYDLLGEQVVYHRFAHQVGLVDVVCEQWAWLVDGVGITLTCSVAREEYDLHADLFEEIAGSVRIASGPPSNVLSRAIDTVRQGG